MSLLDRAISPTEAVTKLAAKGVHISERSLRKRARELGACRVLGKAMILLPEHLLIILVTAKPDWTTDDILTWLRDDADDLAAEQAAQDFVPATGHVYFLSRGDQIKIGYTSNLQDRLRAFRTATTEPVEVLLLVPGTVDLERYYHQKFAEHRIEREWFSHATELLEFIAKRAWASP